MKVILSVPDEDYSRKALCALNLISTFPLHSDDGIFQTHCSVQEGNTKQYCLTILTGKSDA